MRVKELSRRLPRVHLDGHNPFRRPREGREKRRQSGSEGEKSNSTAFSQAGLLFAAQAYASGNTFESKNRNSESENPSECRRPEAGFGP
jgi:hypothetical protein